MLAICPRALSLIDDTILSATVITRYLLPSRTLPRRYLLHMLSAAYATSPSRSITTARHSGHDAEPCDAAADAFATPRSDGAMFCAYAARLLIAFEMPELLIIAGLHAFSHLH